MPSLLSNRLAKRVLRPAFALVEQRLERATSALQADLDALHHEVADLRRRSYGLGLLLDQAGREGHRMPTAAQVDALVREVRAVTGEDGERVRHDITVAYRHLVALEALGTGGLGGSLSDVCGRLATVPLLDPPGGEVLEIGAGQGLFAVALRRMLQRGGVEARLTIVDPLDGPPARADAVRSNLALCGGGPAAGARVVPGRFTDPGVRERVADRAYGVIVVNGEHDLAAVRELAVPGAVVVLGDQRRTTGFTGLGRVAESVYCRVG
ncbi:class I SAM-dependent methyltransferase [Streptomyces sp. HMX112]|uniref:class I SAM-dependent methyltransferase n=1 Tax=Streptomyces sp. HMX112 TaxID=3390850 RepID=UPI003A80C620